ncbi:MAG: hypothetical protein GAK43_01252 [Stenotrophomonas maltophilia]|nr:MAG: hypothetical protein GAK43_01252 [Stenotrophomonas maltophilia]
MPVADPSSAPNMLNAAWRRRWRAWLDRRIPASASVQLNQRRIFIIPTGQGAAFGVALVLLLLIAINYQNSLAYALTFLLLSLFLVTILHTYRNLSGLRLVAQTVEPVFVGVQVGFRVRLEAEGCPRHAIGLGWQSDELIYADVSPVEATETLLPLAALRRGWLRPGRLRVESRFPLGLLVAWSWLDLDQSALVYPRPLAGDLQLVGAGDASDEIGRPQGHGVDDFQGLRSYQPGDPRQRLDWKAYSRGQGLQVKDFTALGGQPLWLDFNGLGGDSEARLSVLCHWVMLLSRRQQPFGLSLPGGEVPVDSGPAHRAACLRALALFGERA